MVFVHYNNQEAFQLYFLKNKFSKINMFKHAIYTVLFSYIQILFWYITFGVWMRPIYQLLLTLARSSFEHNICYKEGLLILVRIYRNCWTEYHLHFSVPVVEAVHLCFLLIVWNSSRPQNSHWPINVNHTQWFVHVLRPYD